MSGPATAWRGTAPPPRSLAERSRPLPTSSVSRRAWSAVCHAVVPDFWFSATTGLSSAPVAGRSGNAVVPRLLAPEPVPPDPSPPTWVTEAIPTTATTPVAAARPTTAHLRRPADRRAGFHGLAPGTSDSQRPRRARGDHPRRAQIGQDPKQDEARRRGRF